MDIGFSELRDRFDAEAVKYAGLRCWGAFGPERDWRQLPRPTTSPADRRITLGEFGVPPKHRYEFWGCPRVTDLSAAFEVFEMLGAQAGDRLLRLPDSVLQTIGIDARSCPYPLDRWLQGMFTLGWKAMAPSLRVPRRHLLDRSLLQDPDSYSCEVADVLSSSAAACQWIAQQLASRGDEHAAARATRREGSVLVGVPADKIEGNLSERLREFGIDCTGMILEYPESWAGAARWLLTLPICWAFRKRHHGFDSFEGDGEPLLIVGLDYLPVNANTPHDQHYYVYDDEQDANRRDGPVLRRLVTAWNAVTYRFLVQMRGDDQYYDFGLADAQRIALLAALTFNKDFSGSVLGFVWPWDEPVVKTATFEGRAWTWATMTAGLFAEAGLVEVTDKAIDYLRRVPQLWRRRIPAPEPVVSTRPPAADELLRFLAGQDQRMALIKDVPEHLRNPHLLTVMDADGLIDFGRHEHYWAGSKLVVSERLEFASVTGPDKSPMEMFLAEELAREDDERIRHHVHLTATGRAEASRLLVSMLGKSDPRRGLTVTEAAKLLLKDVSGITLGQAKARVSHAANDAKFKTNGLKGTVRRIDPDSFSTWRLEQREKDLDNWPSSKVE